MTNFLLIDGSYYVFYRYHALMMWWKHAHPDKLLENPSENQEFMERFNKTFVSKIDEFKKKMNLNKPVIMVAKDCPRSDIWRNSLFPEYKKARKNDERVGGIFKHVYENDLFKKIGAHMLLKHPHLEADDCIALSVQNIKRVAPTSIIYIITSDMDYLQIADDMVKPINLQYKFLQDSKQSFKNKDKDLFCKTVIGDKSDCILPIFKKCGIKTAEKYFNDRTLFQSKLENDQDAKSRYELNKKLIDFNNIPKKYILEFNSGEYSEKL